MQIPDIELPLDEEPQAEYVSREAIRNESESEKFASLSFIANGSNKIFITRTGAFLNFNLLGPEASQLTWVKRIKKHFTLTTMTITKQLLSMSTSLLDLNKKRIIIPRFGLFEIMQKFTKLKLSIRTLPQLPDGDDAPFSWQGQLTENQTIVVNEILQQHYTEARVKSGTAGVIVNLEAGQGKSFLAAYLIAQIKKKTAIILHSTALVEQWVSVIKTALGEQTKIGFYYTGHHQDGDIVIMIVNSASMENFEIKVGKEKKKLSAIEFYSRFGFIIYDECHMYASHSAIQAMRQAQAKYVLGLSATPDEHTKGFDKIVWWYLGPVLVAKNLPGYQGTSENFKAVVHRVMYHGEPRYTKSLINEKIKTLDVAKTINMISEDPVRNELIIDCIIKLMRKRLNIFVFGDRREHLLHLKGLLENYLEQQNEAQKAGRQTDIPQAELEMLLDNRDFTRLVGGTKADVLERAGQKSSVIFTTYQFMGTGKSVPRMTGLVLAHPRRSKMKQYIARIFRLGSDQNIERHIYDIVDMRLSIKNQWTTRKNYYVSKNYQIVEEKINFKTYSGLGLDDGTFQVREQTSDNDEESDEDESSPRQTEESSPRQTEESSGTDAIITAMRKKLSS
jgi:hypothetical protein